MHKVLGAWNGGLMIVGLLLCSGPVAAQVYVSKSGDNTSGTSGRPSFGGEFLDPAILFA